MTEISDLTEHSAVSISSADRLPIWSSTGSEPLTRYVTVGNLFADYAVDGGDHDFGTSQINDLTAISATLNQVEITTSLEFDSASTIETALNVSAALTTSDILAGASETVTATLTGALTTDYLQCDFDAALADGLTAQAWISASDTVSVKFHNTTSGTVSGFSVNAKLHLLRFS